MDTVAGGISRRAIRNCTKANAKTMSDNCIPGNGMTGQICSGSRMMPMTISEVVCRSDTVTLANAKRTSPYAAQTLPEVALTFAKVLYKS